MCFYDTKATVVMLRDVADIIERNHGTGDLTELQAMGDKILALYKDLGGVITYTLDTNEMVADLDPLVHCVLLDVINKQEAVK